MILYYCAADCSSTLLRERALPLRQGEEEGWVGGTPHRYAGQAYAIYYIYIMGGMKFKNPLKVEGIIAFYVVLKMNTCV
jgi:hypothetical protein